MATDTGTVRVTDTVRKPDSDRPAISLIMTVRDGARFLAQALESARAQTFTDWELIVWNDGSTDETAAIAGSFAADDARIRVFTSAPLGRRRALVEAHREARGTYLGWLDADDWLAPDALARTHAAITRSRADMVYTDHVVVTADGSHEPNRRSHIPYSAHRLLLDFITFHFRLFSRDVFDRAGGIAADRDIARSTTTSACGSPSTGRSSESPSRCTSTACTPRRCRRVIAPLRSRHRRRRFAQRSSGAA